MIRDNVGWRFFWNGAFWAFTFRVFFSFASFFLGVILSRILSVEEVGSYFLLISAVSVASAVSMFGLNLSFVRFVSEFDNVGGKPELYQLAVKALGFIFLLSFLITMLFYYFAADWFEQLVSLNGEGWWVFILCMIISGGMLGAGVEFYRGMHKIFQASLFGFLPVFALAIILMVIYYLYGKINLHKVVQVASLSSLLIACLCWLWILFPLRGEMGRVGSFGLVLRESFPLLITNIVLIFLMQFDVWVLAYYFDQSFVGIYGAASRITQLLTFSLVIVNSVVAPMIGRLRVEGSSEELEVLLRSTATLAFVPAFICFLLFMFFGEWLLSAIYGVSYGAGYWPLIVLSMGHLVSVFCGSSAYVLMIYGYQRVVMQITAFCGAGALLFSIFLASYFGWLSVAFSVSVGLAVQCILMSFFVRRKVGIFTHPEWLSFITLKRYMH